MVPFGEFDIWLTQRLAYFLAALTDVFVEILVGLSFPLTYLAFAVGMLMLAYNKKLAGRIMAAAGFSYLFIQLLPGVVSIVRSGIFQ